MIAVNPAFARMGEENAFAVLAKAAELQRQGRDVINLGIGQPDFKTPPHIVEAAVKALRDGEHGYTDATGIMPLREAVSADLDRRLGLEISPDLVMITPGGKVAMFMAILMFGEAGADIVYPDPGFPIYRSMIEFTGARPVPAPMREANGFAFSAEEALALMTPRTRLVILNSPANPTGGVTPKEEIDRLVAGLARFPGAAILSDEIYGQLTYDGLGPPLAARLSGNPRPADPARRLVEDLRHDRLAARIFGMAEAVARRCAEARRQFLFLRQFGGPVRRPCGAERLAGIRSRRCGPNSTAGAGRLSRG